MKYGAAITLAAIGLFGASLLWVGPRFDPYLPIVISVCAIHYDLWLLVKLMPRRGLNRIGYIFIMFQLAASCIALSAFGVSALAIALWSSNQDAPVTKADLKLCALHSVLALAYLANSIRVRRQSEPEY
jgi:hypothetical protein